MLNWQQVYEFINFLIYIVNNIKIFPFHYFFLIQKCLRFTLKYNPYLSNVLTRAMFFGEQVINSLDSHSPNICKGNCCLIADKCWHQTTVVETFIRKTCSVVSSVSYVGWQCFRLSSGHIIHRSQHLLHWGIIFIMKLNVKNESNENIIFIIKPQISVNACYWRIYITNKDIFLQFGILER